MLVFDFVVGFVILVAVLAILLLGIGWSALSQDEQERAPRARRLASVLPLRLRGVGHAELSEARRQRRAS
ncbi:MAG TPA: hypothetical protein VKV25_06950 [Acidimicrobiales bacterium]|nr:hypothetical protein [Acidimicrobiales bacterium]